MVKRNGIQVSSRWGGRFNTLYAAIQFLLRIFFFPRPLIVEQWLHGTGRARLFSNLFSRLPGDPLYPECLQGLSSHPPEWSVVTYVRVPAYTPPATSHYVARDSLKGLRGSQDAGIRVLACMRESRVTNCFLSFSPLSGLA